ncbi:unnamed protein product, partial [Mesorhabditis belari]|uniref:SSD domain-containing protein n=1 Tax=Mesorhabditis belari TaxID=2138241 RepID=A0AAF3J806_9BILA
MREEASVPLVEKAGVGDDRTGNASTSEVPQKEQNHKQPRQSQPHIAHHKFGLRLSTEKMRAPSHKTSLLLAFCRQLSLSSIFRLIGEAIGTYPLAFLISALILCSTSVGMVQLHLRDNVRDGFTPYTSSAKFEAETYKQFLNAKGDPMTTSVLMVAKDGGSMHRVDHLLEVRETINYITNNLTTFYEDRPVTYRDFCGAYCDANLPVLTFIESYLSKLNNDTSFQVEIALTYPIAKVVTFDIPIHLERNFFGVNVTTDEKAMKITNIESIKLILATFLGELKKDGDDGRMRAWEMQVYSWARQRKSRLIDVLVIGVEIVDVEINREAQRMSPYFAYGFISMFLFVCSTVYFSALYFDRLSWYTVIVALCSTVVPVMAITSTLGALSIFGSPINQLLLIMPFLIMGIGVNDSFLTVHAWLRQSNHEDLAITMGRVFEEVGPSITTTTLTNVITFLIGALTPTSEISIFCFGTAIALGMAYIYTLILFGPILYYASPKETKPIIRAQTGWRLKLHNYLELAIDWYAKIVSHRLTALLLFAGSLVYWFFAIKGTIQIESKLDTGKILPIETPIRRPNRLMEEIVWPEYYPLTVIVNNPIDIRSKGNLERIFAMHDQFEKMPHNRGKEFTLSWLREYQVYYEHDSVFDFDMSDEETESKLSYSKLKDFLNDTVRRQFQSFLRVDFSKPIPVQKFSLVFAFENIISWDARITLVQQWRKILESYPEMNATIYDVNGLFVDQIISLKPLTMQSVIWTLICMVVVCALFIQNPVSVALASFAIASISLGTVGYLSFWHLDLDPVSLGAILMSIGMSVDFTAHTTYHYQLQSHMVEKNGKFVLEPLRDPIDKLKHTLVSVAWPMTQAGLSTVICILPLILLQNYIPLVFVKTISLVVIWGLWHGLVLLPACLAQVPSWLLDINCYRNLFRNGSRDEIGESEREMDTIVDSVAVTPLV